MMSTRETPVRAMSGPGAWGLYLKESRSWESTAGIGTRNGIYELSVAHCCPLLVPAPTSLVPLLTGILAHGGSRTPAWMGIHTAPQITQHPLPLSPTCPASHLPRQLLLWRQTALTLTHDLQSNTLYRSQSATGREQPQLHLCLPHSSLCSPGH